MLNFTVENKERLDKFLATATQKSRGAVQKAIKAGEVKVSGKVILETDFTVRPGDVIELPEFKEFEFKPSDRKLSIVFENDDILVIDKPAGLLVHPGAGKTKDTLSHALLSYLPQLKDVGESFRPGIVHRLDEDTSGLLIVAKNLASFEYYKKQFAEHKIQKQYLALVHGIPQKLHDIIDIPIDKNFTQRKMSVVPRSAPGRKVGSGKEAITEYNVLAESQQNHGLDQMALLRVKLHTGRTHQIRVHLSHIGHPIVGDETYGGIYKQKDKELIDRQVLHAHDLKFQLMDGTWIELTAPLPKELKDLLNKIGINYDQLI